MYHRRRDGRNTHHDLKNEDNRTAEVTIIDDDEPGGAQAQEGSPPSAARHVQKAGHARGWAVQRRERQVVAASSSIKLR